MDALMTVAETDTDRLDRLFNTHFAGKVICKDLTKLTKEGAKCVGVRAGASDRHVLE